MLSGIQNASAYVDEILIFSKSWEDHLKHLRAVFERLRKAGMKTKTTKAQFCKSSTKFLGFRIGRDGVSNNPDKVSKIKNYTRPNTKKQVKKFLGFASYYRRFINHFADIADPLNNLTKLETKFFWSGE